MKKQQSRYFFKRILSLLLITAMLAGNLPMTGRSVYAMEEEIQQLLSETISDNEGEAVSDNGEEGVSDNEGGSGSDTGGEIQDPEEGRFEIYPEGDILSVQIYSEQAAEEELIAAVQEAQGEFSQLIISVPTENISFSKELWNAFVQKIAEQGKISIDYLIIFRQTDPVVK